MKSSSFFHFFFFHFSQSSRGYGLCFSEEDDGKRLRAGVPVSLCYSAIAVINELIIVDEVITVDEVSEVEEKDDAVRWLLRATWREDGNLEPLYDLEDRGDSFVLTFDLPNVRKEDVELKMTDDTVEISAKMREAVLWERWGCVQRRIAFESFVKVVKLPEPVDPDKARATLKDGILQIFLPKRKRKMRVRVE